MVMSSFTVSKTEYTNRQTKIAMPSINTGFSFDPSSNSNSHILFSFDSYSLAANHLTTVLSHV